MKRAAPSDDSVSKRVKFDADTLFEDPSLERNPHDIFKNGLTNGSGYMPCACFMGWKPTKKHRAIIETTGASQRSRFEVEFAGACAQFFHEIELKPRDEFLLALKGARVEELPQSSRSCSVPMKLVYEEGVIIKFLKRRGPCRIVDTWELTEIAKRVEDAWFLTPQEPTGPTAAEDTRGMQVMSPSSSPPTITTTLALDGPMSKLPGYPQPKQPLPAYALADTESSTTALQDRINPQVSIPDPPKSDTTLEEPAVQLSKKRRRELKKQQRAALRLATEFTNPITVVTAPPESIPASMGAHASPTAVLPLATTIHHIPQHTSNLVVIPEVPKVPLPDPNAAQAEPTVLASGLITESGRYYPLKNTLGNGVLCNVIGIVVEASLPRLTRTGDLTCNVKLVDPSNTEVDNLNGFGSFQITCFTKQYEQWLPQPKLGEVLILRQIKISDYNGSSMGIGYHDKMRWAIYSPTTGKIRHGTLGAAPESEGLAAGFGFEFSPFYRPCESVIRYCLKLADWWLEVEKRRKTIGETHQVGGTNEVYSRPQRRHRLISEAGPEIQPSGFFDCSVEVLHGHMNDNGVYSLYVTDYTINPAITPVQAEWCPLGLADSVLKVEVWDDAVEVAQTMFAGEYYSIKNARMIVSRGGYVEGKLVQRKVRKLELEEDGDTDDLLFKALLGRKKAWQDAQGGDDKTDMFEYCTIEAVAEGQHFNCFVEILHAVHDGDGTSCIYVTDYTSRDELLSTRAQGSWAVGLDGRILKIALFSNQVEMAKSVQPRLFYDIKKLRMKNSTTARQFQGQLGGMERLIFMLNPNNRDDKLGALKRRKEEWKKSLETPARVTRPKSLPRSSGTVRRRKTIAELEAEEECPNKNRIFARIVDFRPWNLNDVVILNCAKCKQDLPSRQKACFKCDDTDHEYVRYTYQMYFQLQDEDDNQIYVSVNDESAVFRGLKRTDIREDRKGYRALSNRLSDILGNLLEIHESASPGDKSSLVALDTPMLSLIIDSWDVDGKRAYCLAECEDR